MAMLLDACVNAHCSMIPRKIFRFLVHIGNAAVYSYRCHSLVLLDTSLSRDFRCIGCFLFLGNRSGQTLASELTLTTAACLIAFTEASVCVRVKLCWHPLTTERAMAARHYIYLASVTRVVSVLLYEAPFRECIWSGAIWAKQLLLRIPLSCKVPAAFISEAQRARASPPEYPECLKYIYGHLSAPCSREAVSQD